MTVQTVEAQLEALNEKMDVLLGEFESDPAENKWPKWMRHLISSVVSPITTTVGNTEHQVESAVKSIDVTGRVKQVATDLTTVGDNLTHLVTKPQVPALDQVLKTPEDLTHFTNVVASNLDTHALDAMLSGGQNANKFQPSQHAVRSVLEAIDGLLEELDRIAQAALDGEGLPAIGIARNICQGLVRDVGALEEAWALINFPSPVNFDEFTAVIKGHTDDLAKVSPAANSPYRDWKITSSIVIGVLEILAQTFSWLAASFPIGKSVGLSAGVSVVVQGSLGGSISLISFGGLICGGIAALCKDGISILTTIDSCLAA